MQQLHLRQCVHAVRGDVAARYVAPAMVGRRVEGYCDLKDLGPDGSARYAGSGRQFVGNREYRS